MKYLVLVVFIQLSMLSFGQIVSGPLVDEGRELVNKIPFVINGSTNGVVSIELSVDRDGNVVGKRVVESNIKSTPAMMQIKNHVLKYKFEKGTHYPKFHHVIVRVTMLKS